MRWSWGLLLLLAACDRVFGIDHFTYCADCDAPGTAGLYAFVTSTQHTGNLGGLAGADAICQQRATDGGLPGTYVALLSDSTTSAISRLTGSRGWQRTDGAPIADLPDQLIDRRAWNPIAYDESGHDVRDAGRETWTGSLGNGTSAPAHCSDWMTADASHMAHYGWADAGGAAALDVLDDTCDQTLRLYCFETGIGHVSPPPATTGRHVWVSAAEWSPTAGGIGAADAVCQGEAAGAGWTGTFLAALAPDGASTASRFSAGPPWVRPDGALVAATPAEMFGATTRTHVAFTVTGDPPSYPAYWAGLPLVTTSATMTCNAWTDPSNAYETSLGNGEATVIVSRFTSSLRGCGYSGIHLLCLEN
jgi:hypothetical protein